LFIMTVPEQDKDSLHPKYVEKLVEARLYAINEKKHHDGAIITFYCPRCSHNSTVMKPLFFHTLTMDSFMHAVSGYRFENHKCVCGNKLDYNDIVIAQYSHYFHDIGLDLEAEITSGNDFVSFYRMDTQGAREQVDNITDFRYMYEAFGHVFSVRETWKRMLSTVRETRSIQVYSIERGYVIAAIPGEIPHHDVSTSEILGPSWPGSTAVVIRLRDIENDHERYSDSYKEWMREFVDDIARGRIDATVVIDLAVVRKLTANTLKREGIDHVMKDDVCRIDRRPFSSSFSLRDVIKSAAYRGKPLQEVIDENIDHAIGRVHMAESLYKSLRAELPSYEYAMDGDVLEVANPRNGQSVKVDPYVDMPKGSLKTLVGELKSTLSKNERFQPVCKCGKHAFVVKSIEPVSWLKATKDSKHIVYEEKDNAVVVYYTSCGEHMNPIRKTDLAEWVIERKDLDDVFQEELDSLRINIEAHAGRFGDDVIVGGMSSNACDIMVDPAFIKALLDAMKVKAGDRVIAYAPVKELVLIYKDDADVNNLNSAVVQLQSIAATKELKQTPLDYAAVFELGEAHGIINLINLHEKEPEVKEYPLEELPTQEIEDGGEILPEQGHYDISGDEPEQ
jgi:hypothetical protein